MTPHDRRLKYFPEELYAKNCFVTSKEFVVNTASHRISYVFYRFSLVDLGNGQWVATVKSLGYKTISHGSLI